MKSIIGKQYRKEGRETRLYSVLQCDCCEHLTYERRTSRVDKALASACKSCKQPYKAPKFKQDGRSLHPLYKRYVAMKARCYDPSHRSFKDYGGRGIQMCQEWRDDFWSFASFVGDIDLALTLDRVDNGGDYDPSNIQLATRKEQAQNRRPKSRSITT